MQPELAAQARRHPRRPAASACCCGGCGRSRSASSAIGTLITATIAAVASAPNARRSMPSHDGRRTAVFPRCRRTSAGPRRSPPCGRRAAAAAGQAAKADCRYRSPPTSLRKAPSRKLITTIASGSKARVAAGAKRVRAGGRKPLTFELRHRPGALRGPHELDELRPVAELVRPARRIGDPQHVVVAQRAGVASAAKQLREPGDRGGEARVARRRFEAAHLVPRSIGVEISRLVSDLGSL